MTHLSPHARLRQVDLRRAQRTAALLTGAFLTGTLLTVAGAAHAQVFGTTVVAPSQVQVAQFSTTTTASSPTFDRPAVGRTGVTIPTGLSGLGNAVAYSDTNTLTNSISSYAPTSTGTYTVQTSENYGVDGTPASDYVQSIYANSFNPAKGTTNIVQSFIPTVGSQPINSYNINLSSGTSYVFVDHGYYNATDYAANPADGKSFGTANTTVLYNNPGSTSTIPDATPGGVSQTLNVTSTSNISAFNSVTIDGLSQTYLGDLTATLTHNGITVDLFDHTGANNDPNSPGYNYGLGSAAQFSGGNYTFALSGASLAAVQDFTNASSAVTYQATGNAASGFAPANAGNTLNSFLNQSVFGAWTLNITDSQFDDSGSFTGFSFGINNNSSPVPETSTSIGFGLLLLLAAAGQTLSVRRRRAAAAA